MPSATEQAFTRFELALRSLEHVVHQRLAARGEAPGDDRAAEVELLTADRARLAEHLDQAHAHAARMESVHREVSRRLASATGAIRSALGETSEGV